MTLLNFMCFNDTASKVRPCGGAEICMLLLLHIYYHDSLVKMVRDLRLMTTNLYQTGISVSTLLTSYIV